MITDRQRSSLLVEGTDDKHVAIHLLIRHGVDYDTRPWPAEFPNVIPTGSKEKLLENMATGIQLSSGRSIGFVLDADSPLMDRWRAVQDRLASVGISPPKAPPENGYIGDSEKYKCRVGVWLMPDNVHDGTLEHLLQTLIDGNDILYSHASESAREAKRLGAKFSDNDELKAIMHTWLAWREEPGVPYGTAIRAEFFGADSVCAHSFVEWFRSVYRIQKLATQVPEIQL